MNCQAFRASIYGFIEKQLSSETIRAFEEHQGRCEPCRGFLALAREVSCRQLVEFLSEYIEGSLPAEERAAFDRHLALCPSCIDYLDSLRATVRMGAALGEEPCPPLPQELVRAILASRARP